MSTSIIIEKDGERYACDGLTIEIHNKSILYVSDGTANAMASYVTLPPVIRTDNSEVIARLEAENAKLREALKPIMECKYQSVYWYTDCSLAVKEAQVIMKGEKK